MAAVQYERDSHVPWSELLRGRMGDQAGRCTIRRVVLGIMVLISEIWAWCLVSRTCLAEGQA